MIEFLYSLIGFIVAISILVIVHEFGHYWVAKKLGVKVLRFSVGFGKALWTRRAGADQTEYVLAALPLGGYVKMLDENEGKVPKKEQHRAFNRQSIPKRTAIVLAGPLFNFLFAILAYWLLFIVGMDGIKPVIIKLTPGSIAEQGGFRVGDEIVSIDGKRTLSFDQHRLYLFQKALDRSEVDVEVRDADGYLQTRHLNFSSLSAQEVSAGLLEQNIGWYGYIPEIPPVIGFVEAQSPAAKAGLKAGDRIAEIDGHNVQTWQEAVAWISKSPDQTLRLVVQRDGALIKMEVTPRATQSAGKTVGKIGAGVQAPQIPPEWRIKVRYGPVQALWQGVENTWLMSALTLNVLYKMLKLEVSTENISGPISIARYAGYSAQIGWDRFLMFLAVVSISLGVLNLLPVPVLDGGHLLYYAIEAVKGSPVSEQALEWGQRVGAVLLVGLMILAFYNDFVRILH
ncbi:MAG TPA: RIP metalloprotease RseP [Acidiferrobacterales bacterium]|nr:RIP metalloprotease RseP [Acidiferrobacterales bacterium]